MSDLYLRRSVRRAYIRAIEADWNVAADAGMPSPMITPLQLSQVSPNKTQRPVDHSTAEASIPFPSQEKALALEHGSRWPRCPIKDSHSCPDRYFHANQYPNKQQCDMLAQEGFTNFFEGGNPPPMIWAAFYRILNGETDGVLLNKIYAYRFNHCPARRTELLKQKKAQVEEEELMRKVNQMNLEIEKDLDVKMGGH
ncbi:MAG: hypothetical protein Q9191_007869 [Dirinaria sp. TL-2023a]